MIDLENINYKKLQQLIGQARSVLLTTHMNPDCDGLGSELALYKYLVLLNKDCRVINISGLPDMYKFLDSENVVEQYIPDHDKWIKKADITILLDIGESNRIQEMKNVVFRNTVTICIDHHPVRTPNPYDYDFIKLDEPSTGSIIWKYFKTVNFDFSQDVSIANSLYAALVTDTGSFKYNNTNEEAHIMACELIKAGVKPYDIHREIYENRSKAQMMLFGKVINNVRFYNEGQFALFTISENDLNACQAGLDEIEGFTDFVRSVRGVEIASMLLQLSDNKFRVNFRSKGKFPINDIAEKLNGGGHPFAAGALVNGMTLADAKELLIGLVNDKINRENI